MAKKKAKVAKRSSAPKRTRSGSGSSWYKVFHEKHPSALLYLVLFLGCVLIWYLINWYSDLRVQDALQQLGY